MAYGLKACSCHPLMTINIIEKWKYISSKWSDCIIECYERTCRVNIILFLWCKSQSDLFKHWLFQISYNTDHIHYLQPTPTWCINNYWSEYHLQKYPVPNHKTPLTNNISSISINHYVYGNQVISPNSRCKIIYQK